MGDLSIVPSNCDNKSVKYRIGKEWWCDGTSRNDVSPYECSGTPGPIDESSPIQIVPALIHSCHSTPTKTYGVFKMTGMHQYRDIVSHGTINLGNRGPRTFVWGHILSGRSVTPPNKSIEESRQTNATLEKWD